MPATVHTIDLHYLDRSEAIASYLVVGEAGGPVLVEVGPGNTLDGLVAGLEGHGFRLGDVRDALVTHIHLDHAGAAGHLAREGCRIHVHEFGVRHLVDPSRLLASAERIYGDRMASLWGEMRPVPADRVVPLPADSAVDIGGIRFEVLETPGHARHHHAFALDTDDGRVCLAGDAAAAFVPGTEFIALPTPPPEFDLDLWLATLDRLERGRFDRLLPTHFGDVGDVGGYLDRVRASLRAHVAAVLERLDEFGKDRDAAVESYHDWFVARADAANVPPKHRWFYLTQALSAMNLAGIRRWRARTEADPS